MSGSPSAAQATRHRPALPALGGRDRRPDVRRRGVDHRLVDERCGCRPALDVLRAPPAGRRRPPPGASSRAAIIVDHAASSPSPSSMLEIGAELGHRPVEIARRRDRCAPASPRPPSPSGRTRRAPGRSVAGGKPAAAPPRGRRATASTQPLEILGEPLAHRRVGLVQLEREAADRAAIVAVGLDDQPPVFARARRRSARSDRRPRPRPARAASARCRRDRPRAPRPADPACPGRNGRGCRC